jgi:hypothetical protein
MLQDLPQAWRKADGKNKCRQLLGTDRVTVLENDSFGLNYRFEPSGVQRYQIRRPAR